MADDLVHDADRTYLRDLELKIARTEGELGATVLRLASLEASDEQHRIELEAARSELASSTADLEHVRRKAHDQDVAYQRRVTELESRLAESEERRRAAARERQAVIAARGRRGRRRFHSASIDGEIAREDPGIVPSDSRPVRSKPR